MATSAHHNWSTCDQGAVVLYAAQHVKVYSDAAWFWPDDHVVLHGWDGRVYVLKPDKDKLWFSSWNEYSEFCEQVYQRLVHVGRMPA